ncbi:hypothetical protein GY45DRAFT_1139294 [Cubamyces sp. BRFM 1775]|nr:hypothetical protein GY45DRAFT_1139294 [Cubamyces sp. BRFM 1775]
MSTSRRKLWIRPTQSGTQKHTCYYEVPVRCIQPEQHEEMPRSFAPAPSRSSASPSKRKISADWSIRPDTTGSRMRSATTFQGRQYQPLSVSLLGILDANCDTGAIFVLRASQVSDGVFVSDVGVVGNAGEHDLDEGGPAIQETDGGVRLARVRPVPMRSRPSLRPIVSTESSQPTDVSPIGYRCRTRFLNMWTRMISTMDLTL